MSYSIKEIFYSLQGEGFHSGRSAVFLRFAGCNLWTGREEDRADAICSFCDTDFVGTNGSGGGKFQSPDELAEHVCAEWTGSGRPFIVCTGGEPLLQLDHGLVEALHVRGCEVAVETNGTLIAPDNLDWICVSPKAGSNLVLRSGHELKLVFPQPEALPCTYENLDFEHYFLQPMDGDKLNENTRSALQYCLENPRWKLSLQLHKLLGIP